MGGRPQLRLFLVLIFWKCDEGEGGGGGGVVVTNQKMWFVTGFVCDAWTEGEKGVGRRSLTYQRNRPPFIARTLFTLYTRISLSCSLSTGYRHHHHLSMYISIPDILALPVCLPTLSVPVPSPGRRGEGRGWRPGGFQLYFYVLAPLHSICGQAPALYRIVRRPFYRALDWAGVWTCTVQYNLRSEVRK